ncbi:hypothetical protein P692DRAFT_20897052, partial [Suillus brevipes Sb2]
SNSNQLRNSSPVTCGRSAQPRNKVRQFLTKVKDLENDFSVSRESLEILGFATAFSKMFSTAQVQDRPSGVERRTNPQLALREVNDTAEDMDLLSRCVRSGVSAAQS